jgi:hypothetical protein
MDTVSKEGLILAVDNFSAAMAQKNKALGDQLLTHEQRLDQQVQLRDIDGVMQNIGSIRKAVLQGFVANTTATAELTDPNGDFTVIPNLGTNANVYLHVKLPININTHAEMFWFHFTGYAFGASKIIDEQIVGYCYQPSKAIINVGVSGTMSPGVYADANGNVVLRILFSSVYYATVNVETMRVGNGRLFSKQELVPRFSLSSTMNF